MTSTQIKLSELTEKVKESEKKDFKANHIKKIHLG